MNRKTIDIFLLAAILVIATFFRFHELSLTPPGLYPDVAVNGNDALETLRTGNFKLFYPENNGREGLIIWLDAWSIRLFGISSLSLKIPAAIIGALTVLGVYLLAKQLFPKNRPMALLSAFFIATSFWHINFSRIGFRAIIVPFCLAFSFYFLWRAFKDKKIWPAAAAGIFFGLGFYTYTIYRLAVFLLLCGLAGWFAIFKKNRAIFLKVSGVMLIFCFLTALPIGIYFLGHPADFFGRAGQTSAFSAPDPFLALAQSLVLHAGMFNFYGDANWRHNYSGSPQLFWPVGIFFLAGLAAAAAKTIGAVRKKIINEDSLAYLFLLCWFFSMLAGGFLTIEGVPHSLRTIGVIPAVMILAALGAGAIYNRIKNRLSPTLRLIGLAALVLLLIAQGYRQYFINWAQNPNVAGAFTQNYVDIARLSYALKNQAIRTVIIVNEGGVPVPFPDGIPMPAQTVIFSECENAKNYAPYSVYLTPEQIGSLAPDGKTAVIPIKSDPEIFNRLWAKFPQGEIKNSGNINYFEF